MAQDDNEPVLPETPTYEGRIPRINNFGYNVPYGDLWPLLIGLGGSMILAIACFAIPIVPFHWSIRLILTALPITLAHFYVKKFVEDALPHTQDDTICRLLACELDFSQAPVSALPFIPAIKPRLVMAADPEEMVSLHPMARLQRDFEAANKRRKRG